MKASDFTVLICRRRVIWRFIEILDSSAVLTSESWHAEPWFDHQKSLTANDLEWNITRVRLQPERSANGLYGRSASSTFTFVS